MHQLKTGALLRASGGAGRAVRRADLPAQLKARWTPTGRALGLAFQVVDDVLDATADSATLGKTAGKDAAANKPTYVSILGLERIRRPWRQNCGATRTRRWPPVSGDKRALRDLAEMVVIVQRKA